MGYNQTKMGEILGLTPQGISEIERGTNRPSKTVVKYLKFRYPNIFDESIVIPDFSQAEAPPPPVAPLERDESLIKIGERLASVRAGWNLTEDAMAKKLQVGPASYRCYEQGEMGLPASMLAELLMAGVDASWLLRGVVAAPKKNVVNFSEAIHLYFKVAEQFEDKELALQINENLVALERANPEMLADIGDYVEMKMRRIGTASHRDTSGKEKTENG